jgi:hypothetical protein
VEGVVGVVAQLRAFVRFMVVSTVVDVGGMREVGIRRRGMERGMGERELRRGMESWMIRMLR